MILTVNDTGFNYLIEKYINSLPENVCLDKDEIITGFEKYVKENESEDVAAYLWGRLEVDPENFDFDQGVVWNGPEE